MSFLSFFPAKKPTAAEIVTRITNAPAAVQMIQPSFSADPDVPAGVGLFVPAAAVPDPDDTAAVASEAADVSEDGEGADVAAVSGDVITEPESTDRAMPEDPSGMT